MFFRNLTLFRLPDSLALSNIEGLLSDCALEPVGALELASRGFIPPHGHDSTTLSHRVGDAFWVSVGSQDKLLPSSVVNDLLQKKLAEVERREGRRPGGRTRKRLKEDLVHELLPRAFVRPGRTDAIIDIRSGLCAVDTSSRKQAEAVVAEIRHALGCFPAIPLNAGVAPRAVFTGWVAGDPLPEGLTLGDECELRDAADRGACWKGSRTELGGEEVAKHLEAGKQVTRVALSLDDHATFVLGEDLVLRKFRLLDGAIDALESTEREDLHAELDARFALMASELQRLFQVLEPALAISKVGEA